MAEELRPDIERARSLMSYRLGSNREIKRLADFLYDFEQERSSNSVETHVHRLRRKLAAAGADVSLRTLRGLGYLAS